MPFQDGHSVVVADQTGAISSLVLAWLRAQGLGGLKGTVDVTNYGADPTGVQDSKPAVLAAIKAAPVGGTIFFPEGVYWTPWVDPQVAGTHIDVSKKLKFVGPARLRNFVFYIHGSVDYPKPLIAAANEGDKRISVAASGWKAGDYVQVLSQYNVYTADAGGYQGGSVNPTNGTQTMCRTGEIHRVQSVNGNAVALYDLLTYGNYKTNTTGQANSMVGVTTAEARRLRMLDGVQFQDLTFAPDDRAGHRGILARNCSNLVFRNVTWETPPTAGAPVRISNCYGTRFYSCRSERGWDGGLVSGSGITTFYIGGGCTNTVFENCDFVGEAQGIDLTTQTWDNVRDIGYEDGPRAYSLTTQHTQFRDNDFRYFDEGITIHPASMHTTITGNTFAGGSTGVRCRARRAHIEGNTFYTSRAGVSLSAFVDGTTVRGNQFVQAPSAESGLNGYWLGVQHNAYGSEILTHNAVKNLVIQGNTFHASKAFSYNWGVLLECTGDATNPAFTDTVRRGLSSITVQGNTFDGCSVFVNKWVHGVSFLDNAFRGGSDRPYYIDVETDAGPTVIHGSTFDDRAGHVRTAGDSITGYSYDTRHVMGTNATTASSLAYALTNTRNMTTKTGV
mgnify:CR=1 FL=1